MPEDEPVDPVSPSAASDPSSAQTIPVEAGSDASVDAAPDSGGDTLDAAAIEELLKTANFEDPATVSAGQSVEEPDVSQLGQVGEEFKLPNLTQVMQDAQVSSIELLRDVELNVKIELGRARMLVEDVLKLCEGSVVELDKLAGDPVDVFVNDRLVARGEVLVLNDNFCVRVNEIIAGVKDEGQ
jgi:flagellar motor switch protein FliN/FliY